MSEDNGYRQATRNNVLLTRVIVALLVAIVAMAFGYAAILPLKTTEWLVYEFSSSNNTFVRVARAGDEITANDALTSMLLRKYVMDRETINHVDEQDRYASVMAQSSSSVATNFKNVYGGENSPLNISGYQRAVLINRDSKLGKGLHQVEFTTTDTINGIKPDVRQWVATIAYTWSAQEVRADDITFNPAGLVIQQYSPAKRDR